MLGLCLYAFLSLFFFSSSHSLSPSLLFNLLLLFLIIILLIIVIIMREKYKTMLVGRRDRTWRGKKGYQDICNKILKE